MHRFNMLTVWPQKKLRSIDTLMNLLLKAFGLILVAGGVVLTCKPGLIGSAVGELSAYEMIERRVKWGFLVGVGIFLFAFRQWGQWGSMVWALLAALTLGIIISRLLGFMLDGIFVKQIIWLLIEIIIAIAFSLLYWRCNR
jgi:hypothetical protein